MKSVMLSLAFCAGLLFFSGCASAKVSPMQKRHITTHQIEGSYENVYRATMTVIQDQDYVVKNTDLASGLIVASIDREAAKASQFWQSVFVGTTLGIASSWHKGTIIELSATLGKINDNLQELRMNLQETRYNKYGGKTDIKQILDAKIYQEFANQVTVEVKRREALKR